MTADKEQIIHSYSSHLSSKELLDYNLHVLSGEEKKRIEAHLSSCELCSDAMKGLRDFPDAMRMYNITRELKKRINKRPTVRKHIFNRMDLISIITLLFMLGIILLVAYYLLIFKLK